MLNKYLTSFNIKGGYISVIGKCMRIFTLYFQEYLDNILFDFSKFGMLASLLQHDNFVHLLLSILPYKYYINFGWRKQP
jgi:hypothetical protein